MAGLQRAAAAAKFNMRCVLVLSTSVSDRGLAYRENGNILIDRLLGAEIRVAGAETDSAALMLDISEQEAARGRRSFIIPVGGSNAVGTLGYVDGFLELCTQFAGRGGT